MYGVRRKVAVPDVTYYRSSDNGLNGAPHHSELSIGRGGPNSTQRLEEEAGVSYQNLQLQIVSQ